MPDILLKLSSEEMKGGQIKYRNGIQCESEWQAAGDKPLPFLDEHYR